MSGTTIRLSEEAKTRLDLFKREGESYEDVILRLTERDKWAGFGVLADSSGQTRSKLATVREELREGMSEDIEQDDQ